MSCSVATSGGSVKHGDISTTAIDISFSILFEFYFIFSLYFEALLYYLYRSFHAYVIRASKRQRHCVRPSPEALRGTSLEMPGPNREPLYLTEHAYKANRKSV